MKRNTEPTPGQEAKLPFVIPFAVGLVDLDGRDRYDAAGGATQGQSGGNEYHFHSTGALSFSLLLDLGAKEDIYSRERANNATAVTGDWIEIYNPTNAPVNISGWFLSDSALDLRKYAVQSRRIESFWHAADFADEAAPLPAVPSPTTWGR